MAYLDLQERVLLNIRNVSGQSIRLFDTLIVPGATQLVPVYLEFLSHPSWPVLIRGLQLSELKVGFPGVGGIAEKIVEAALRQIGTTKLLLSATSIETFLNTTAEEYFSAQRKLYGSLGFWRIGRTVRISAAGVLKTNASTAESSIAFRVRYGGGLVASTGSVLLTNGIVDNPWSMTVQMTCQTIGSTGTLAITGQALLAAGGLATALATPGTGVGTYNLQNDLTLALTAQWDVAHVDNIVKLQSLTVEDMAIPIDI